MRNQASSYVRVLGSANATPTKGFDHSCYSVNDDLLIDACPSAEMQLLDAGIDPNGIAHILFTHFHADHYMGLPALLFYRRFSMHFDLSDLTIYGPAETIEEAVAHCLWMISEGNISKLTPPKIVPLKGGEELLTENYRILAESADHTTPALCYRVQDERTGHSVGFTGDTAYQDKYVPFFQNVDLLIHEASYGASIFNENAYRHSSAEEAVLLFNRAHAKQLLLTHLPEARRESALQRANELIGDRAQLAQPGKCIAF